MGEQGHVDVAVCGSVLTQLMGVVLQAAEYRLAHGRAAIHNANTNDALSFLALVLATSIGLMLMMGSQYAVMCAVLVAVRLLVVNCM